jgi:threonine/homoserine/homoserine lactone efflux protein
LPEPRTLLLFGAAAAALLLTPGPVVLFLIARSGGAGRRAGFAALLGVTTAGVVHVAAAVLGLSAMIAASAVAFTAIKLAGAAYLIYLGIRALVSRDRGVAALPERRSVRDRRHFLDGFLVNLFNPKAAVFFMAFLPQFVDPELGSARSQLAALGLLFLVMAFVSDGAYAMAAGSMHGWLSRNRRLRPVQRYASAAVYLGLGVTAAMTGRKG